MFSSNFVLQSFPDVNSCWIVIRNNVIQLMKKYHPNKIARSRKIYAWMNTDTRRMVHRKNRAFTKAQFTKCPWDLQGYKYLKSKCQRIIRQAYNAYKTLFVMMQQKNHKFFLSFVKSKKQDASGVAPLYNGQDDLCSDPLTKSNIFSLYLQMMTSAPCQG